MDMSSRHEGALQIVEVNAQRIDAAVAIQFKDMMRAETDGPTQRVILDLSQVEFIDSSGLGAIVAAMKQLGPGRQLDLAGLTPNVDSVFRLTRMDTVFSLYPTLDAALMAKAV
ncbi:STAS domain-containing protein [Marinovum sp. 2_MG-2023]|uniref:STAS domain-containing protein n=1 Tax=Roseobacteraceae TaxID=2854170 RepID=UPI001FD55934|nr:MULTISPECIES: STAS domain-containing protein [Roseobacteraceae]MCJ7872849.1 STAS domain-containing protein [Phaeobacter sp. J2-8]MDO6730089.1 STAS domain-containing protein [Marinovum sp. 2_MG-2023]MDO6779903.1 STAS domain-containing protein [Marinovum sp. 1_MG-2023]